MHLNMFTISSKERIWWSTTEVQHSRWGASPPGCRTAGEGTGAQQAQECLGEAVQGVPATQEPARGGYRRYAQVSCKLYHHLSL